MPARLNPKQDDRSRSAIQTTQLCKRLNAFALGLPDPASIHHKPLEMSDAQIRAALGLLRKTLPDLAVTQIEGAGGGKLEVEFRWKDASPPTIDAQPVATDVDTPSITFIGEC